MRRERASGRLASGEPRSELDLFSVLEEDSTAELTPRSRARRSRRAAEATPPSPPLDAEPGARPDSAIGVSTLTDSTRTFLVAS